MSSCSAPFWGQRPWGQATLREDTALLPWSQAACPVFLSPRAASVPVPCPVCSQSSPWFPWRDPAGMETECGAGGMEIIKATPVWVEQSESLACLGGFRFLLAPSRWVREHQLPCSRLFSEAPCSPGAHPAAHPSAGTARQERRVRLISQRGWGTCRGPPARKRQGSPPAVPVDVRSRHGMMTGTQVRV